MGENEISKNVTDRQTPHHYIYIIVIMLIIVILNDCISIIIHHHLLDRFLLPVHIDLVDPLKICCHRLVFHCQLYTANQLLGCDVDVESSNQGKEEVNN